MSKVKNILWAEDNIANFNSYKEILEEYLSEKEIMTLIDRAEDGKAVFQKIFNKAKKWDLIILDIDMPNYNGLLTIEDLASQQLPAPLMIISNRLNQAEYRAPVAKLIEDKIIIGAFEKDDSIKWRESILSVLKNTPPRILHISDIHFGKFHIFSKDLQIEDQLIGKLEQLILNENINLIVISGDLTSVGDYSEFKRAEMFIEWLSNITKLPITRFIIVPGNHDIRRADEQGRRFDRFIESINRISKGNQEFCSTFSKLYKDNRLVWDLQVSQRSDLYSLTIIDELKLIVVGLNSVIDDENNWEQSEIPHLQLINISRELASLPVNKKEYLKIAVFHHNLFPIPAVNSKWENRVISNQALVLKELSNMGFRVILHGHSHYPGIYQYRPFFIYGISEPEPIMIVCTGTLGGTHTSPIRPELNMNLIKIDWATTEKTFDFVVRPFTLSFDTLIWEERKTISTNF